MNIAICDDNPVSVEYLSTMCRNFCFIESITPYHSPKALVSDIQDGTFFNVVLMDIDYEMEKNGIDYAEEIYQFLPLVRIIYVTGYVDRYVQNIFLKKSALIGFLMKPVQENILEELLYKAKNELDADKSSFLCTSGKGASQSIPCSTILFLESNAHKVHIHTETSSEPYIVYEQLSSCAKRLPSCFQQCHKSYLINMDKIQKIEKNTIFLTDTVRIHISRAYAARLKQNYFTYMQRKL